MATYSIHTIQRIPSSIAEVWNFFSDPGNLRQITPSSMQFRVTSQHHGNRIYAGQIIEYRVKPLFGIPVYWMTEITHVVDQSYFIDEQRFGPYRLWHHQHHFRAIEGGVEMKDIVHYRNPLGVLGNWANALFVQKKLNNIFQFRFQKVQELFGTWPGEDHPVITFGK